MGKEVAELVTKDGDAAWLKPNDRRARLNLGSKRVQDPTQELFGGVEVAVVVEWPAAAERLFRHDNCIPCCFQYLDRRHCHFGMEVVIERVGPEHHSLAFRLGDARGRRQHPAAKLLLEGAGREGRKLPRGCDPAKSFHHIAQHRRLHHKVREPLRMCRQPCPSVDQPHRVRRHWAQASGVVM